MKKTGIRLMALLLCGALLCGAAGFGATAAADSVSDLEKKLQQLEKDAASYRGKINSSNKDIATAKANKEYYDKQIEAVSEQIDLLEDAIDALNDKIYAQNKRIDQTAQELADADIAHSEEYARLQQRMRALAKTGNVSTLQMLLDSGSYTDYLLRSKVMSCIAEKDQQMIDEMERELTNIGDRKTTLENEKAELEKEKAETNALKKKSNAKKAELDSLCAERKKTIARLEQDVEYYQNKLKEAERAEREVDNRLKELLKQESTVSGSITLPMFWPVPNLKTITSVFGPRGQIGNLNTSRYHRGYDIAGYNAAGSKIYAAESGKVITSTYHWSYGNYVEVDHGYDGQGRRIVTRYAHMSKRKVSVGDTVTRGKTVLGLVGETGQASGPHLHFEVRVNGDAVDSIKKGYLVK